MTPIEKDHHREDVLNLNLQGLAPIVARARDAKVDDFALVVIDADDPAWRELAEGLVPDIDQLRALGARPFARGRWPRTMLHTLLSDVVPSIAEHVAKPCGLLVAVFAAGGCGLYRVGEVDDHLVVLAGRPN